MLWLFLALPEYLWATAQFGDCLIIGTDTTFIHANPLEEYFEQKGARTIGSVEMVGTCTALWRGYVATWQLDNDSLFLVRLQTDYCGGHPTDIDLRPEFGKTRVFAAWVSSTLVRPTGALLHYVHVGYASIYEGETFYYFKNGLLQNSDHNQYLIRDSTRLFPGKYFLLDTMRTLILLAVPLEQRQAFDGDKHVELLIAFDTTGTLTTIELSYAGGPMNTAQSTLLAAARTVLSPLPPLMLVQHKRYHPPVFHLWFSGHCLKYPDDREYGCEEE